MYSRTHLPKRSFVREDEDGLKIPFPRTFSVRLIVQAHLKNVRERVDDLKKQRRAIIPEDLVKAAVIGPAIWRVITFD